MARSLAAVSAATWNSLCVAPAHRAATLARLLRATVLAALDHDVFTVGQATAYSAMVGIFPALIVAAAVVGMLPDTLPIRYQLAGFFDRILPSNVSPLLDAYFSASHKNPQTSKALLGSVIVSLTGASTVVTTLMEGFRRAHDLPLPPGSFWPRRIRGLVLVPLSLLPMAAASALVVFGHWSTQWLVNMMTPSMRTPTFVVAAVLRWAIALAGSVGIIAVIYHLGTDMNTHMRQHLEPWIREPWGLLRKDWTWRASLPGAALATVLWFGATLLFGFYVTRFANYSRVYGSLGAGIALMVWLYLISLCILIGAEFNAQVAADRRAPEVKGAEALWKLSRNASAPDR